MAVSIVPALLDALVTQASTALPGIQVSYGQGVSDDPGDFLMIGVDDPDGPDWARSMTATRDWETVGLQADITEEGDITCAALSWNGTAGSDGQKAATEAVYATAEALATVCRTDPTLGLPNLLWVLFGGNADLRMVQNEYGSAALFLFQIHFRALI